MLNFRPKIHQMRLALICTGKFDKQYYTFNKKKVIITLQYILKYILSAYDYEIKPKELLLALTDVQIGNLRNFLFY